MWVLAPSPVLFTQISVVVRQLLFDVPSLRSPQLVFFGRTLAFVWFACFLSLLITSRPGSTAVNKQYIFKKENWKIQISISLKLKLLLTFVVWSLPMVCTCRDVQLQFPNVPLIFKECLTQ